MLHYSPVVWTFNVECYLCIWNRQNFIPLLWCRATEWFLNRKSVGGKGWNLNECTWCSSWCTHMQIWVQGHHSNVASVEANSKTKVDRASSSNRPYDGSCWWSLPIVSDWYDLGNQRRTVSDFNDCLQIACTILTTMELTDVSKLLKLEWINARSVALSVKGFLTG